MLPTLTMYLLRSRPGNRTVYEMEADHDAVATEANFKGTALVAAILVIILILFSH